MIDEPDEYVKVIVEQGKENFQREINDLYPEYRLKQVLFEDIGITVFIAILEHTMYHDE